MMKSSLWIIGYLIIILCCSNVISLKDGFEEPFDEDGNFGMKSLDDDFFANENNMDAAAPSADNSFVETASGIKYKVLETKNSNKEIGLYSTLYVHYIGTLTDGKKFDSSYDRGEPMLMRPDGVIPGWTEALLLMHEGDKWKVIIPSELGYGSRGAGEVIPADATLIFEVEVLEVDPILPPWTMLKFHLTRPMPGLPIPIPMWQVLLLASYIFTRLYQAFGGSDSNKSKCKARHILVKEEKLANDLKKQLDKDPSKFEALAEQHSSCPSKKKGGSLGTFNPGSMVKEFDQVCFDPKTPLNKVQGPVKTKFGYHLIVIDERSGPEFSNAEQKKTQ